MLLRYNCNMQTTVRINKFVSTYRTLASRYEEPNEREKSPVDEHKILMFYMYNIKSNILKG